jgi:hypothetical protein
MDKPSRQQLTFWIEEEVVSELRKTAKQQQRSVASLLRLIVITWKRGADAKAAA